MLKTKGKQITLSNQEVTGMIGMVQRVHYTDAITGDSKWNTVHQGSQLQGLSGAGFAGKMKKKRKKKKKHQDSNIHKQLCLQQNCVTLKFPKYCTRRQAS